MLCSWDAEEYALIGSVEFVELHAKTLREQAVVYINVDIAIGGANPVFQGYGMPSLSSAMVDITRMVPLQTEHGIYAERERETTMF